MHKYAIERVGRRQDQVVQPWWCGENSEVRQDNRDAPDKGMGIGPGGGGMKIAQSNKSSFIREQDQRR